MPWLRADPVAGLANTLFVLAIVWASDIGAYLVGRLVGGPKLAPAISPGKTWSGAVGGLVSAALAGLAVAACFSPEFSPSHVIGPGDRPRHYFAGGGSVGERPETPFWG